MVPSESKLILMVIKRCAFKILNFDNSKRNNNNNNNNNSFSKLDLHMLTLYYVVMCCYHTK